MYVTPATAEQEARGLLAESRFFFFVNLVPRPYVRGFLRVEQASPLLDVRGIDGFVYHHRRVSAATPKRIPFQLKTGFRPEQCPYHTTRNNLAVPIIPISVQMTQDKMLKRIRQLLDAFDATPCDYESKLREIESWTTNETEMKVVAIIEAARVLCTAPPQSCIENDAHSMA